MQTFTVNGCLKPNVTIIITHVYQRGLTWLQGNQKDTESTRKGFLRKT